MPVPNSLQRAGEFLIDKAELTTSQGITLNILAQIMHINIFEDIQLNAVSGTLFLSDTINIATVGPVLGQEYLSLKLSTTGGFGGSNGTIDFTKDRFHITSLGVRQMLNPPNLQALAVDFTTHEVSRNQRTKLNRTYQGEYSKIVETILKNDLKSKKKLNIEPTDGVKKVTFPNIRPFDAINLMKRESVSVKDGEPTYMFYEDLQGYHFRSLADMYKAGPVMEYKHSVVGSKGGVGDSAKDLSSVLGEKIISNGDTLVGQHLGEYASTCTSYDSYARKFDVATYNYLDNFRHEKHISSFPLVSTVPPEREDPKSRISDFPAKSFLVPVAYRYTDKGENTGKTIRHLSDKGEYIFNGKKPETWLQRGNSQNIQLESAIIALLEVHGQTGVRCGSIVEFNMPVSSIAPQDKGKFDKFFNGKFLVKSIRHDFAVDTARHEMVLTIVKDALPVPITGMFSAPAGIF